MKPSHRACEFILKPEKLEASIAPMISEARKYMRHFQLEPHQAHGEIRELTLPRGLARIIEHTKLKPDNESPPSTADIVKLCKEAREGGYFGVCVNRGHVALAKTELAGSDCKVVTVISFPYGNKTTCEKIEEAKDAIKNGADELDMVINIEKLMSGRYRDVYDDIRAVVVVAGENSDKVPPSKAIRVKVILETAKLSEKDLVFGCMLAKQAGAHFVKTSTGFENRGASVRDILIMHQCVEDEMGIKASGGISIYSQARNLVLAGATRIGSSKSVQMMKDERGAYADFRLGLEHARELFIYHADQRNRSINFFFAAVGLIVGGMATSITKIDSSKTEIYILTVASVTILVLSSCFLALDCRNANLVHCDEGALKLAEAELARLNGVADFQTVVRTDLYRGPTYKWIMRVLFVTFIGLGISGIICAHAMLHSPRDSAAGKDGPKTQAKQSSSEQTKSAGSQHYGQATRVELMCIPSELQNY